MTCLVVEGIQCRVSFVDGFDCGGLFGRNAAFSDAARVSLYRKKGNLQRLCYSFDERFLW